MAMDSFRGAKPAQDKTAKTFFLLDLRACLSIPQNEAPQVPSRTQRNQLTLLGKETRPICKTNTTTTKCNLSAASVLRFKGVHVNSRVRIVHLICVDGCYIYIYVCVFGCHPVFEFPKALLVCLLIFLLFDCKNCVLVTSCRSRSDCSSTGWLFLNEIWRLQNPKLLAKPKFEGHFLK